MPVDNSPFFGETVWTRKIVKNIPLDTVESAHSP